MAWDYPTALEGESVLFLTDMHFGRREWTASQHQLTGVDVDSLTPILSAVAVGGDQIHWSDPYAPEDPQWLSWRSQRSNSIPWAVAVGNHDLASFMSPNPSRSVEDWGVATGTPNPNQSFSTSKGLRIITLAPDEWTYPQWDIPLKFSDETLNWLDSELDLHPEPTFIVAHSPLPEQYPGFIDDSSASRISQIIGTRGNVVGWLSGHRHANIQTDLNHAKQITVGGRRILGLNAPSAGGQVAGTTLDPWDSPLYGCIVTYKKGEVIVRWRNLITRSFDSFKGSKTLRVVIDA